MKYLQLIFWVVCIFVMLGCKSDKKNTEEEEVEEKIDSLIASLIQADTLVVDSEIPDIPEVSEEKEIIENTARQKSVFLDLGCCQEEGEAVKNCCCEVIVKKYAKLYKDHIDTDPLKLNDIKTTDPFFGNCMELSKWKKLIELIENPEPVVEEDNYDDVW